MTPDMTYNDEPIVFIEYHDGRVFQVFTAGGMYDFEWNERLGRYLCRDSGGGGPYVNETGGGWRAKFWAADGVEIHDGSGKRKGPLSDAQLRSMGLDRVSAPLDGNPFAHAIEGEFSYCNACHEHVPDEGNCGHLFYVQDHGVVGCGSDLKPDEHKASFFTLLSLAPIDFVRTLRWALARCATFDKRRQRARYSNGERIPLGYLCPFTYKLHGAMLGPSTLTFIARPEPRKEVRWSLEEEDVEKGYDDYYAAGIAWLRSLTTGYSLTVTDTPEADAITLEWLDEYLAEFEENDELRAMRLVQDAAA